MQEFFGVKVTVGAGLSMVEVGWGKPFGGAVFAFAGDPAPGGGQLVVGASALGEFVDVGFLALGEVRHMMHLGEIARYVAVGERAAAVLGVEDDSLSG